ncbi:hypothetical protein RRG08_064373 [Elysia crispata]|uniref:VWFA domain-containing protein n=1 Tax=Elysia crispata TaxID=231223 RepID=A0AAE0YHE3_9GAST|nr:hypothetical protein RRG08_064373 [Elysia crispata]
MAFLLREKYSFELTETCIKTAMLVKPFHFVQLLCVGTALVCFSAGAAQECSANVDVIFLVDASTSVGEPNFRQQLSWVADVTDQFLLAENGSAPGSDPAGARFGAVVFSRDVVPLFRLGAIDKPSPLRQRLQTAQYLGESSHVHAGLLTVYQLDMFSSSNGGRVGARDVLVLVSDGKSSYSSEALFAAYNLKTHDVTIMTAGLTPDVDVVALRRLATSRADVFILQEGDIGAGLEKIKADLAQRICAVASES